MSTQSQCPDQPASQPKKKQIAKGMIVIFMLVLFLNM